jgi:hypothetical protein
MAFATYKIFPRSISIEKSDLKKLIDFIVQKTNETKEAHKQNLNHDGQTEEQKTDLIKTLDEAYVTAVFVYGVEGEEFIVYDSNIIDAP